MSKSRRGGFVLAAVAVGAAVALSGCASGNPLGTGEPTGADTSSTKAGPIVVGSQDYYSNEIIAEIYAQALEANGMSVDRQFRIGQREVYLPDVESGAIDLMPEYTGNLLQYYDKTTKARTSQDVYAALKDALPKGMSVLDQSDASDQDSYNVTAEFAKANNLKSLADLAQVKTPLTLGGNSELETRPYGPKGLKKVYGVTVGFTPIEDDGGPLTFKALQNDSVQLVDIYSADPRIQENNLVTLDDPKGLFLASHVVPLVSGTIPDAAVTVINKISAAMSAADLVSLNTLSVDKQESPKKIAADWLDQEKLF